MMNRGKKTMQPKQIALVTGTTSGIGMLTVVELAKQGCIVFAGMRDLSKKSDLEELAITQNVQEYIDYVLLDVTNDDFIKQTIAYIIERYGRIDILVNNAGVSIGGFSEETLEEDWRLSMETNFFGTLKVTRAVQPYMRKARSGQIINISSISGRFGFPAHGPYTASKFAINGFSESLRLEMLPFGVYVVLIEPGAFKTNIWSKNVENMKLRTKENSPYEKFLTNILHFTDKLVTGASDPRKLASKIARITQIRQPKLRYTLGKGSFIAVLGKAIVPWKWLEKAIVQQMRK